MSLLVTLWKTCCEGFVFFLIQLNISEVGNEASEQYLLLKCPDANP